MHRLLGNVGWLLGGRGINALLSLVYLSLAARTLGLDDFGRFTLIVVMAQMTAGVASFSTWQGIVRWGQDPRKRSRVIGFAVALDLASIALGALVAAFVALTAPYWLPLPADLRPAAFALCLTAVLAIRSTPTGILRLHDRYASGAAAEAALPATRAVGAIVAWHIAPNVAGYVAAWGAAELACAGAHWYLAARLERVRLGRISLRRFPRRHPGAWRFVLATNGSRSLSVLGKQAIVLVVGAAGGAALAGGYRIAAQLGQALVQLADAIARALYPELVRAEHRAAPLARRVAVIAAGVGMLAAGLAFAFGRDGLALLAGPEFVFASDAMVLLALAGAAELVTANWDSLLTSKGRAGAVFIARALPLVGGLCLLPAASRSLGLVGVAGSMLGAALATATWLSYLALVNRPPERIASGVTR